jgi:large subunit ribosomal protein L28
LYRSPLGTGHSLLYDAPLLSANRPVQEEVPMAQHCHFCGKTPMTGKNVSHAHNVTSRKWHLNLQSVRAVIAPGTTRRVRACSRCLRSGKVVKPTARIKPVAGKAAAV